MKDTSSRRRTEIPKSSSKNASSSTAANEVEVRNRRHSEIPSRRHTRRRRSSKEREKRPENGPKDESRRCNSYHESRQRDSSDDNKRRNSDDKRRESLSRGGGHTSTRRKGESDDDEEKKRVHQRYKSKTLHKSLAHPKPQRKSSSVDDIAVYEYNKLIRRKSTNESIVSSKDDLDMLRTGNRGRIFSMDCNNRGHSAKKSSAKRKSSTSNRNSSVEGSPGLQISSSVEGRNISTDNLERFEELLQKSKDEYDDTEQESAPESGGKKIVKSKSKSGHSSIDKCSRPKRRLLDTLEEDEDESWARRSSQGPGDPGRHSAEQGNALEQNDDKDDETGDVKHGDERKSSKPKKKLEAHSKSMNMGRDKSKNPVLPRMSPDSSSNKAIDRALGSTKGKSSKGAADRSASSKADSMVVATDGKAMRRRTNSCDKMQALVETSLDQDNLQAFAGATDDTNGSANKDTSQQHDKHDEADKYKSDKRRSSRPKKNLRQSLHRLSISNKADGLRSGSSRRSSHGGALSGTKKQHPSTRTKRISYNPSSASKRKSSRTSNTRRHDEESSSHCDEDGESRPKTEAGETTSELDAYLAKKRSSNRHHGHSSATRKTVYSRQSQSTKSSTPENQHPGQKRITCCQRIKRHKWQCLCCCTVLILVFVAIVVTLMVLRAYGTSYTTNVQGEELSDEPSNMPSSLPSLSMIPTEAPATMAPTPSQLTDISIVVIVQLDAKPEETGFSLTSADNSTTYVSYSPGDLAGMQGEVVMEVVTIIERTELVFTVTDESEDGLCCTYGSGYYKILAPGSGDEKMQIISGEQSAKYVFAAGEKKMALQIGGVDPNEYCKPCPDGKDCGRCAWCDSDEGFLPDTVFHYQCKSQEPISIPKRCFVGEKRYTLHNQYISAMAGCSNNFEAGPQNHSFLDKTICVEEAHCVKTFAFVQPDCEAELTGSFLVKETCQDLIGGLPFGYSWGLNAPREKECQSSQLSRDFAESLAQRCCVDGVSFCSTFKSEDSGKISLEFDNGTSSTTTMPAPGTTYAPTMSHPPTWDGYPITILLQLDKFPRETGLSITSVDKEITYFERIQGYYKKSQLVVEKVRIPLGIEVILTLTDKEGDGMQDGDSYIQVYSERGSIILDEEGLFSEVLSRNFIVGEPDTEPPTASVAPSMSMPPTFNQFPITIVLQLDQWSDETGFSIKTTDENEALFDWPIGTFATQSAGLVKETVYLPSDAEAELRVTDAGGDGFCCLYGDGYVKIFAGLDTEDESNLIAFESGDFDSSELSMTFRAGPDQTVSPATTLTPTTPKTKSEWTELTRCDAFEMTLVLQLDKYSAETEWSIDSSDGLTNYFAREDGYYEKMKSEIVIETICLAEGYEYRFRIADFMGDGTCCWAGNGWYSLYEGKDIEDISTQVFYDDGEFGRERIHMFVAGKPVTPAPTMSRSPSEAPPSSPSAAASVSSMPTVTAYAVELTIALDSNSHETGWHIAKEVETFVIDRPPGYYTGNDTQSVVETIRLEAGDYTFTALDTAGNGFCCGRGVGFYSLYSNGESLLFRQGMFEYSYSEAFTIAPKEPGTDSVAISKMSTPMLRGSDQYPNKPQRQRKHVDQNAFIDT